MEFFVLRGIVMAVFFTMVCGDPRFISWSDMSLAARDEVNQGDGDGDGKVIVVAKDGTGDSTTVQGAVQMVPDGNHARVKIFISKGVYREQVHVPSTKRYISFIGNGQSDTVISRHVKASDRDGNGNTIGTMNSATVAIEADYFCASGITFENTAPGAAPGKKGKQAVALRLTGDKAMIYRCNILGSQDTLYDHTGRHFFYECYIQGSIDFVFGIAKSLYQDCTLHSVAATTGAIAASQRNSSSDDSGFAFLNCRVTGSGMLYLGRAWGWYSRVVYAYCYLDDIIIPEGWSDWGDKSRRRNVMFGEFNCNGRGANLGRRVPWARPLTYDEARPFLDRNYINGDQWLRL